MKQGKRSTKVSCQGGCHCGRVRFDVKIPSRVTATLCNCSICSMTGFVHLFVERSDLALLRGENELAEYRFNTEAARHFFCRHCGIKSFYVPRSHPQGYSVNLKCLDIGTGVEVELRDFDGRHWRKNIAKLRAARSPD